MNPHVIEQFAKQTRNNSGSERVSIAIIIRRLETNDEYRDGGLIGKKKDGKVVITRQTGDQNPLFEEDVNELYTFDVDVGELQAELDNELSKQQAIEILADHMDDPHDYRALQDMAGEYDDISGNATKAEIQIELAARLQ